jgi:hypothetical protein
MTQFLHNTLPLQCRGIAENNNAPRAFISPAFQLTPALPPVETMIGLFARMNASSKTLNSGYLSISRGTRDYMGTQLDNEGSSSIQVEEDSKN